MKTLRIAQPLALAAALLHLACVEVHSPTAPRDRFVPGSGPVATVTRQVTGFDGIELGGAGELHVEVNGREAVTITAEESLLPYIRSEVVGSRLVLGPEPGFDLSSRERIVYRVSARALRLLAPSGASLVEAVGLDAEKLEILASGASTVRAEGRADRIRLELSGASRLVGDRLPCRTLVAHLSGASLAIVRVSERLSGSLSGASNLEYHGDPSVDVTVSGSSRVRRLD